MARYRDPLLWSVHDLRSRVRTILDEEFLTRYLAKGEDPILDTGDTFMKPYALRHTMFVLAEYLGWVEILRRRVGFLDLGNRRLNRRLVELLSRIRRALFATDLGTMFHVPTGHQRAIGELMITSDADDGGQGWRCIGFAHFCSQLDTDRRFAAWFERLNQGILQYSSQPEPDDGRLRELNLKLTELIDFLDPDLTRFPLRDEEKPYYRRPEARTVPPGSERPGHTVSHVVDQVSGDPWP